MKKIILTLLILAAPYAAPAAQKWPAPVGYVNDFAKVIPGEKAQILENFLVKLKEKTGAQVVVVTVTDVEGADINRAAVELFKAWGIGQKGKDDGVLILAAINDHRARIEVGYGLEGVITDGTAGDILRQELIPQFKNENYGQGLADAAAKVALLISQNAGVSLDNQAFSQRKEASDEGGGFDPRFIYFILFILYIVFRIWWAFFMPRRRGFWGGGTYGGGWGGGGGFGGGGGGFGGFGGGGSGGGGASGGW